MHLLLGDNQDSCCTSVRDTLEARGYPTRLIPNPVTDPVRFSWTLGNGDSASSVASGAQPPLDENHIAGVFVRHAAWIDPRGWRPADLAYVQAETQAALLAWLWSLRCPVVNRCVPAIWYRPRAHLLSWQKLLERCGLPVLDTLVTNVEQEARRFGRRLAAGGVEGVVYGAVTSDARYLIASDDDWSGLAALQRITPVLLAAPHGEAELVCVVGERVIWDREPAAEKTRLETGLRSFAAAAGLAFVAVTLAPASSRTCVVAVETSPDLETFCEAAKQEIVEGIVELLTGKAGPSAGSMGHPPSRSSL